MEVLKNIQALFLYLFVLILGLGSVIQFSLADDSDFYTAAVVEHVRFGNLELHDADDIVSTNLNTYRIAVNKAAESKTDIIVFPEWGLYPHNKSNRTTVLPYIEDVPNPKEGKWNPCEDQDIFSNRRILVTLSCLAKDNNIYLVANMGDYKKCDPIEADSCNADRIDDCKQTTGQCPSDGMRIFNTIVVFDRSGTLIARYYKIHLYFERDMNPPVVPENTYFETDFGVLFTTFVCFDMAFKEAVEAIEEHRIMNVAYPTYWFDHFPSAIATQFHQSWAYTNNVNVLAANVHLPGTGTMGSGIYSGRRGALIYTHNPDGRSKILISKVPKRTDNTDECLTIPSGKRFVIENGKATEIDDEVSEFQEHCSTHLLGQPQSFPTDYRCAEANVSGTEFKKLDGPSGSQEVCNNGFCCSVDYQADSLDEDYYVGAYSNVDLLYGTYGFCMETCIVARCDYSNEMPYAVYPSQAKTLFRHIELRGDFSTKYVYPSVIKSNMRLASTKEWSYDSGKLVYNAKPSGEGLLIASLYGRCYERDPVFPM